MRYRLQAKAMSLVASGEMQKAFNLSLEPDKVRERYGRHKWGQSHLLARRLVEAGVPFVTTVNGESIIWDTHLDNFNKMQKSLVPPMEQAFSALLEMASRLRRPLWRAAERRPPPAPLALSRRASTPVSLTPASVSSGERRSAATSSSSRWLLTWRQTARRRVY